MHLVIFDLDNTLIGGDSDHAWGEFLVQNGYVDAEGFARQNDQFYRDYQAGNLDIMRYQEFALAPLTRYSADQLAQMHALFMQNVISPMMLPKASALINDHRQRGHCLLIITATNRFVTGPIAKALGIDNLIATEGEIHNGNYTGSVEGTPSFGEGKIIRLNQWLSEHEQVFTEQTFYSDSANDLPLLKQVDHAIAVDPDDALRASATQQGWPIISLRE